MASGASNSALEIRRAFAEHDREVTINNFKVACLIGAVLMPCGYFMDRHKYPGLVEPFLQLRFLSSALIGLFLGILLTPFGRRHYRFLGIILFMVPASLIAAMIYATHDPGSSYYAGLNLVLLALAFVLHWTFRETLVAASLVLMLYLGQLSPTALPGSLASMLNNLFFLGCTGSSWQ